MEDPDLLDLGRKSRKHRRRAAEVPELQPRQKVYEDEIPRRSVQLGGESEPAPNFVKRMKDSPIYVPVVFVSLGSVIGAGLCNYYYVTYPPAGSDKNDRWQRTLVSAAVGGAAGLMGYFYIFKKDSS